MLDQVHLDGPGYDKVLGFCAFARRRHATLPTNDWSGPGPLLQWGWVDTCCIDKSSSAELSEAINSMFAWYQDAALCCVYLTDVRSLPEDVADDYMTSGEAKSLIELYPKHTAVVAELTDAFMASNWFTRGWTLQELFAPKQLVFCGRSWAVLGHKCCPLFPSTPLDLHDCPHLHFRNQLYPSLFGPPLNIDIERATGVSAAYLASPDSLFAASIACRMSWASRRKATRVEDLAYCLLGLFRVHMSPIYGEGHNAFRRLQEELIQRSNDQSIFAWFDTHSRKSSGMLAASPSDFALSANIVCTGSAPSHPYAITNNGLEVHADLQEYEEYQSEYGTSIRDPFIFLSLNCGQRVKGHFSGNPIAVFRQTQLALEHDIGAGHAKFYRRRQRKYHGGPSIVGVEGFRKSHAPATSSGLVYVRLADELFSRLQLDSRMERD